jgi:uncharacterized coiled-coil DUF342 family protein
MKDKLEKRLEQLKNEFVLGQKNLLEMESQVRSLKETLLRISGAIQVLEEELNGKTNAIAEESGQKAGIVT